MRIPKPFIPVEVTGDNFSYNVGVLGRSITFGVDSLPKSIMTQGKELLSEPVRICGIEDGKPIVWDTNYPDNESECFIQSRSDEQAVLCGSMQSELFIVNSCITAEYDGTVSFDLKIMPRGKTVAQVFGLQNIKPRQYKLERLWLEIPLVREYAQMYNIYPNSDIKLSDGTSIKRAETSSSGKLPEQDAALPFKALLWLGNDDFGLGWFAENNRNWQSIEAERAIEFIHEEDKLILRVRLLDSQPVSWNGDPALGCNLFEPISFKFGLQATPVKTFPKLPYLHNALHIDCFIKTKGNYIDFLSDENRFDRLKEKGVTTLILHEKWNKSQNWFELSEFTADQLRKIVHECHKRGIKVLTYFGYEISTLSPIWSEQNKEGKNITGGRSIGGWYRVPFQRDYIVCYNSSWQDKFVDGICKLMDKFHTDGVYLDGTSMPRLCENTEHGCGFYDADGKLHGSYAVNAVRGMFRRLYDIVEARGGMINVHAYGYLNFTALPYIHQTWYGENLQFAYIKGSTDDMPLDYFRAEYAGRNMGVPVEFIAYENRPIWNFENAIGVSIIHGILPRPNDIGHPLELMSGIWKVIDSFPVAQSDWCPYWKNDVRVSDSRLKVSYYRYTAPDSSVQLLVFCANTTTQSCEAEVDFGKEFTHITNMANGIECGKLLSVGALDYKILYVR